MTSKLENHHHSRNSSGSDPLQRLENLLSQPGNRLCADCGSQDPKWVSLNLGVFICIKCSGVHRSLGVHISKVLSVKLDEWTDEQVDSFADLGGNAAVNMRYEAFLPEEYEKPKPDSSIEERSDFIRRKYEQQEFLSSTQDMCIVPSHFSRQTNCSRNKHSDKQLSGVRHSLGHAFRSSWRKKESEHKAVKKMMGMVEFIGLIKVNVIRGTNLAVRDVMTSDPYVILNLGHQSMKTRVIKRNLNPVWNERLILSIPDPIPPLKLQVFDKDMFSTDDHMGEAEVDIQPLVSTAKAYENSSISDSMQIGRWLASNDNPLVKDSIILLSDGKVKQEMTLKLQNVERGELEIELECVPLSQ
ncbi:probable ADP-ribosylation factor GTPase-activating protein AGD11 [Typha angustifolia]|uniref:probable ADP-ribosylation factor GTPase-activating protein AGD11 n=1 Tax=Typha angustifolia TaxID=59011 RepID=UPI003C2E8AA5